MTLRVLLVLGFGLAVAATALVVFADGVRMLRLAVVLALWAALIAAFAVTRSRREAKAAATRENEAQLAYQLELHREVAARREYEADLNKQVAAAQSDQLAELRGQLERLTGVLSSLADGELTVSRLTLSAESARFRAGTAEPHAVRAGGLSAVTVGEGAGQDPSPALAPGRTVDADETPALGVPDGADPAVRQGEPAGIESPAGAWARRHAAWARARDAAPQVQPVRTPPEGGAVPEQRAAEAAAGTADTADTIATEAEAGGEEPTAVTGDSVAVGEVVVAGDDVAAADDEAGDADAASGDGEASGEGADETATGTSEDDDGAEEEPGDHESGVSVADLLAAYGLSGRRSRRRRG